MFQEQWRSQHTVKTSSKNAIGFRLSQIQPRHIQMRRSRTFMLLQKCINLHIKSAGLSAMHWHSQKEQEWTSMASAKTLLVTHKHRAASFLLTGASEQERSSLCQHSKWADTLGTFGTLAPGPGLSLPLSSVRLMSRKEFLRYVPRSFLVYPLGFLTSDDTTMRHLPCCQMWRRVGSSMHKQSMVSLAAGGTTVSGFLSF